MYLAAFLLAGSGVDRFSSSLPTCYSHVRPSGLRITSHAVGQLQTGGMRHFNSTTVQNAQAIDCQVINVVGQVVNLPS
jgi:hypothetical protein